MIQPIHLQVKFHEKSHGSRQHSAKHSMKDTESKLGKQSKLNKKDNTQNTDKGNIHLFEVIV